jgi:hypothetical protein
MKSKNQAKKPGFEIHWFKIWLLNLLYIDSANLLIFKHLRSSRQAVEA